MCGIHRWQMFVGTWSSEFQCGLLQHLHITEWMAWHFVRFGQWENAADFVEWPIGKRGGCFTGVAIWIWRFGLLNWLKDIVIDSGCPMLVNETTWASDQQVPLLAGHENGENGKPI